MSREIGDRLGEAMVLPTLLTLADKFCNLVLERFNLKIMVDALDPFNRSDDVQN